MGCRLPAGDDRPLEALTTLAAKNTDFVLWPEAATPFLFEAEADYREELLGFVRELKVPLLFGSPATMVEKESDQLRLLNSAFLISADGRFWIGTTKSIWCPLASTFR